MSFHSARRLAALSVAIGLILALAIAGCWLAPSMTGIAARVVQAGRASAMYAPEFFSDAGPKIQQGFRDSAAILFVPLLVTAIFAFIAAAVARQKISTAKAAYLILLLSVLDLIAHGWNDPPLVFTQRDKLYPPPGSIIRYLQNDPDTFRVYELHKKLPTPEAPLTNYSDLQRVRRGSIRFFDLESVEFVLRPDTLMPYGIESAGGYMSLYPGRYKQLWGGRGMDVLKALKPDAEVDAWNAPWIGMQNIKYILAPQEYRAGNWKPVLQAEGISVLKVDSYLPRVYAVPRARVVPDPNLLAAEARSPLFDPAREVLLETDPPQVFSGDSVAYKLSNLRQAADSLSFSIDLANDAYVVIAANYFPWWRAQVNGKETKTLPANASLQCLPLMKGTHNVHMDFRPPYYTISLILSLASACCLLLAGASLRLHAGKKADDRSPVL